MRSQGPVTILDISTRTLEIAEQGHPTGVYVVAADDWDIQNLGFFQLLTYTIEDGDLIINGGFLINPSIGFGWLQTREGRRQADSYDMTAVLPTLTATYYYHTDHLGTPRTLTDQAQQIVWQANYEPFGKVDITVDQITNNLRFPGQYHDEETGLSYNYHRYYDPATGRYITSDPIGLSGGLNTYGYVFQNPIGSIDPSGLDCVAVGGNVTCNVPGAGTTISFPRPDGWPDKINSDSSNHHVYDIPVDLQGADPECVRKGIQNLPTPGSPYPATPDGTTNNATPTTAQDIFNMVDYVTSFGNDRGGYNNSPVQSYSSGGSVVNVTMPGHPLHPGYVMRSVNGPQVNNIGEGLGKLQGPYSPLANMINGVWDAQTQAIIDKCKCNK